MFYGRANCLERGDNANEYYSRFDNFSLFMALERNIFSNFNALFKAKQAF